MRSAFIAAALAAGALAVPFQQQPDKRALVVETDVDVVYFTEYTTVTLPYASKATEAAGEAKNVHYGHWHHHHFVPEPAHTTTHETTPAWTPTSTLVSKIETTAAPSPATTKSQGGGSAPSRTGSATEATGAVPTDYQEIAIYHHNLHRANHSASPVTWDDNLASIASTIAQSCVYAHNVAAGGGGYGQNIAAGVQADNISAIITDLFYNGEVNWYNGLYGQAAPSMTNFEHWGHFSQIVWKATTTVGCATQDCSGRGLQNVGGDVSPYFTVCNYGGPGNVGGEYGKNIGEPLGNPTAQWNTGLS